MNVLRIPEQYMVEMLWALHPSSVLLTNQEIGLSDTLNPGIQATVVWNSYLLEDTGMFEQ